MNLGIIQLLSCVILSYTVADTLGNKISHLNPSLNAISDSGFENNAQGWSILAGGSVGNVSHSGKCGLTIKSITPAWCGIEQLVTIPFTAQKMVLCGWMKTTNVIQGKEAWETAGMKVDFTDSTGKQVGGYQKETASAIGNTDWKYYSKEYVIPEGSRFVKCMGGLANTSGTVHFDDVSLYLKDNDGKNVAKDEISGPMDEGEWYPLEQNNTSSGGHYVDWSSLLDAPAGKHGFLTVNNGSFVFKDGTPVRFWGTNLMAKDCFASNTEIDSLVNRLSKMGCNLLRLHHMDAPWTNPNIFGNTKGNRSLSPTSLKRLDYLIAKCKSKGVYIFLDLLVHREFSTEDSVAEKPVELGGKQVAMYSRKLIALQKEYASQLLSHVNEYTKIPYNKEPAIIGSEIINESTIFTYFSNSVIKGAYKKELDSLWKISQFKDKTLAEFSPNWLPKRTILQTTTLTGDIFESISFLTSLESSYYREMNGYLRSIGIRYPLSGSNMPLPFLASLKSNASMDFTISNDYWDHPQVWKMNNDWSRVLYSPLNNNSQLKNIDQSVVFKKAYFKVKEKPFLITEWNHCYPNEYTIESIPLLTAYGRLQGWDGALQFYFNLEIPGKDRIKNFELSIAPEQLALWVVGAPLFLRGDVKTAPGQIVEKITDTMTLTLPNYSDFLDKNFYLPFITRVSKTFTGKSLGSIDSVKKFHDESNSIINSQTGELSLNYKKGNMTITTPNVQGVSGFIANETFNFPAFSCNISNTNASIFTVSKNKSSLSKSSSYYLVIAGAVKMSNQKYSATRTNLTDIGTTPVLAQVIKGTITFSAPLQSKVTVTPLSINGTKGESFVLSKNKSNKFVFHTEQGRTLVYEVSISK